MTWTEAIVLAGYQTDCIQDPGRLRKNSIAVENMSGVFRTVLEPE